MIDFIKDVWLWIVIPFVLVAAGIAYLVLSGGTDGGSPFNYNVF